MYTRNLILTVIISINAMNADSAQLETAPADTSQDILQNIEHHYAINGDVKLHYVSMGQGPVLLFVHGFPDFWYSWRDQMKAFSDEYQVVAMDLRGYNRSDSPVGVENYTFEVLIEDIAAVVKSLNTRSVHLIAHDWGAAISWRFAAKYPTLVNRLVILSISHPKAGDRRPKVNVTERKPSYADRFVSEEFRAQLNSQWFSGWVKDSIAKIRYQEAFSRSDKDAMINYYKANFPTLDNLADPEFLNRNREIANLQMPVMIIHGKKDPYASTRAHNNTWQYIDGDLTITVLQNAGHFIQQDQSDKLTGIISNFIE